MNDAKVSHERRGKAAPSITVSLRIPGRWPHPKDLIERLNNTCRVTSQALILPNGTPLSLGFFPSDDQFPGIFRSSCRWPPTQKELATANSYTINATLSGSGGSMNAARMIMKAAATMVRAGGAGVFIDNSLLAHGGKLWLEMTEDGGLDALTYAFAGIVRGDTDLWTVGMHVLGLQDIVVRRVDLEDDFDIVELIRSVARGDKPDGEGRIFAGSTGLCFSCCAEAGDPRMVGKPMHNPFGRLRLAKFRHSATVN